MQVQVAFPGETQPPRETLERGRRPDLKGTCDVITFQVKNVYL